MRTIARLDTVAARAVPFSQPGASVALACFVGAGVAVAVGFTVGVAVAP